MREQLNLLEDRYISISLQNRYSAPLLVFVDQNSLCMKKSFKMYLRICKVSHIIKGTVSFRSGSRLADAIESLSVEFSGFGVGTYDSFYLSFLFLKKIVEYTSYNSLYDSPCNTNQCKK